MIGFFGIFGRSSELRRLDQALREVDLHPRSVPEAVKVTALKLLKEAHGEKPEPPAFAAAAELLGYCMLGPQGFAGANGADLTAAVEGRLEAALAAGDSLDARLVLLALYAGVIQPAVVERYGLETAEADSG
jgi:hypothetical protein